MPSCFHGLDKESVKVRICAGLLFFGEEMRHKDCVFVLNLVLCAKKSFPSITDVSQEKLAELLCEYKSLDYTKLTVHWSDYKR